MAPSRPTSVPNDIWTNAQGEARRGEPSGSASTRGCRVLRVRKRELTVNFPVTHDDGRVEVYSGYRVTTT